jgi:signal transduction histidine kinase
VVVTLTQTSDWLRLSIVDDGCGFETEQVPSERLGGLGLRGIRERLKPLDGTLQVRSAPDQGTELDIVLPLNEGEHASRTAG